jgi:hypothetical protein
MTLIGYFTVFPEQSPATMFYCDITKDFENYNAFANSVFYEIQQCIRLLHL